MATMSLGRYLESLLEEHTDPQNQAIDIYAVAADLGFFIKKVAMFGTDAGILIPNPPLPNRIVEPLADIYRTRIELNEKLPDSTLRPVVAWLLSGFLMCGNPQTSRHFKCEIFETRSWRSYQMCHQMFLATRLLMPAKIINHYCQKVEPGVPIFDSAGYAKIANVDHIFVQCCYSSNDVSGLLGIVSDLELKMSSNMKEMMEQKTRQTLAVTASA